jgi:hypothetical protein
VEFADESAIHAYAKDAIHQLYRAGLINGKGGGLLDPLGVATRAEAAAIMHRLALALAE